LLEKNDKNQGQILRLWTPKIEMELKKNRTIGKKEREWNNHAEGPCSRTERKEFKKVWTNLALTDTDTGVNILGLALYEGLAGANMLSGLSLDCTWLNLQWTVLSHKDFLKRELSNQGRKEDLSEGGARCISEPIFLKIGFIQFCTRVSFPEVLLRTWSYSEISPLHPPESVRGGAKVLPPPITAPVIPKVFS